MEIKTTPNDCLQKVIDSVQNGDTLILSDGFFRLTQPVILDGKKDIKIVGGENTVITGSTVLSGV